MMHCKDDKGTQHILTTEELKKVQQVELEMLTEVHRLCQQHDIKYSMVGGTMLGAVRHGGFIPWDDDADVAMLRKDYNRFVQACETSLDHERFYFQDIHNTEGYRWGYGKLRRKHTKFIRLGQEFMPYEQGIFIDIFPLDSVPDQWLARMVHKCRCFLLRKALWSEVGKRVDKNRFKRLVYSFMAMESREHLVARYDRLVKACDGRETQMVRILTFPTPEGTFGFYRRWYTEQESYPFESIMLRGPKDYDGWLTYKFGDYMTLPPKEQQKIHPISQISFDEGKMMNE